ncbi:hypothetical protein G4228_013837 [Cervus hanglu yarkandensis]|nr:hypothetical protein G4228_013837 [Cervus hanglu yarkandensis]
MAISPGSDAAFSGQKSTHSESPRSKKFPLTEEEIFYMNCRAAYLTVFKSSLDNIISKDQLYLENFDTKKNELTRQGFMDLNLMEANDREGDPRDLWVTLHSMGYNKALELTEACPFVIDIYADKCKPRIKAVHMEACSGQLEKAICKSVLNKGNAKVMDGYENIIIYTYKRDTWITSVIENKVCQHVMPLNERQEWIYYCVYSLIS